MTTPINDFQDILDAIERNPALRDALRRHILTDKLLQMPVRLERVEEDIGVIKGDVATLKEGQARLLIGPADAGALAPGDPGVEVKYTITVNGPLYGEVTLIWALLYPIRVGAVIVCTRFATVSLWSLIRMGARFVIRSL